MKARGSFVDAGMMLERWFTGCPDLEDVHYGEMYTPIGPWLKGMADPNDTMRDIHPNLAIFTCPQ